MAALAAGEETDIEAWVDACYGETSSEWRNLIAMDSRMELAEDLPPLIESEDLIYGEFGIRLEDCAYITDEGPRWFSGPCHTVDEPFGYDA